MVSLGKRALAIAERGELVGAGAAILLMMLTELGVETGDFIELAVWRGSSTAFCSLGEKGMGTETGLEFEGAV